jgi:hypothetical protein
VFDPYRKTMEAHLKEEEEICVPLMFAYFEPKYVGKKAEEIMKTLDKTLMGSFVHHQGSKKEFQVFAKQEGVPFFVWYLELQGLPRQVPRGDGDQDPGAARPRRAHQGAHQQEGPRARHEGWRDCARRVRVENTAPRRRGGVNETERHRYGFV